MKTAAFLAIFAILPLRAQDDAQEISRIFAAAQSALDAAVTRADRVVVEAVESKTTRSPIWSSSSDQEIRALVGAFRIAPPKIERKIVGGKEQLSIVGYNCFCYGQLWVTFKRNEEVLLSLLVFHGRRVASETAEVCNFQVEEAAMAPFFGRMMALAKEKRKMPNKATEPTPPVTAPAGQEPRRS